MYSYRTMPNMFRLTLISLLMLTALASCKKETTPPPQASQGGTVLGGEVVQAERGDDPVQGAVVELVIDGRTVAEAVTDADGRFRLEDLPASPFRLRVSKEGDFENYEHPETLNPSSFSRGRKFIHIPLEGNLTTVTGIVLTEDGEPVEGATIRTYPATTEITTAEDGTFELRSGQFLEVEYRVDVSKADFESKMSEKVTPQIGMKSNVGTIILVATVEAKTGTGGEELGGPTGPGNITPGAG